MMQFLSNGEEDAEVQPQSMVVFIHSFSIKEISDQYIENFLLYFIIIQANVNQCKISVEGAMDLDTEPKVSEETDVTSEEIVLVSNAVPIPGTCRRKDRFADQGKYEMSWLLTSKLIAGNYQYEQTDLP